MSASVGQLRNTSLADWNFTRNCSASADYVQQLVGNSEGAGLHSIIHFLENSLPQAFISNATLVANDVSALITWFLENEPLPKDVIDNVSQVCKAEICPLLQWEGEPDAAGIGIAINLYLTASLAFLYSLFFILDEQPPYLIIPANFPARLRSSLKITVQLVLELTRQLSLAFLISVLIILARAPISSYSGTVAGLGASGLAVPTLIFEIVFWEWYQPRTPRYLAIPASFICVFAPALVFANVHQGRHMSHAGAFYALCFDLQRAETATANLHWFIGLSQPTAMVIGTVWILVRWKMKRHEGLDFVEKVTKRLFIVLLLAAEGAILYTFTQYRIASSAHPGDKNKEGVWSLGQILLLSNWVPAVIEIAYIMATPDGLEAGFDRKVPAGYDIPVREVRKKRQGEAENAQEMEPFTTGPNTPPE